MRVKQTKALTTETDLSTKRRTDQADLKSCRYMLGVKAPYSIYILNNGIFFFFKQHHAILDSDECDISV